MTYDVDYDYEFEYPDGQGGLPLLPDGLTMDGNLYVLPNGRYLPSGACKTRGGSDLIYEPNQLTPWAGMLAHCAEE